ncbi:hypothetical protein Tco_0011360 [Tanacetum coccineum]
MRTRSQSREQRILLHQKRPTVVIEPLRIEYPFQEDPTVEPMADTRTMVQLLQAPTEGLIDVDGWMGRNADIKDGVLDPVSEATPKLQDSVVKGTRPCNWRDQTPLDSTTGPSSQPDEDTSEKEILPNPEHMDDEFLATVYPKVHENLKLITDKRVFNDKPESQSGSMSSMKKNLDDNALTLEINFCMTNRPEDDQEISKATRGVDYPMHASSHPGPLLLLLSDCSLSEVFILKCHHLVTPSPIHRGAKSINHTLLNENHSISIALC